MIGYLLFLGLGSIAAVYLTYRCWLPPLSHLPPSPLLREIVAVNYCRITVVRDGLPELCGKPVIGWHAVEFPSATMHVRACAEHCDEVK